MIKYRDAIASKKCELNTFYQPPSIFTIKTRLEGVHYMELNGHAEHLGELEQEEYYQNED